MGSIRHPLEIDGTVASPTTESSLTLKLTGAPFSNGLNLVIYSPVRNG